MGLGPAKTTDVKLHPFPQQEAKNVVYFTNTKKYSTVQEITSRRLQPNMDIDPNEVSGEVKIRASNQMPSVTFYTSTNGQSL